jgi:hypothetical protein
LSPVSTPSNASAGYVGDASGGSGDETRQRRQGRPRGGRDRSQRTSIKCFTCDGVGHIARNCPHRDKIRQVVLGGRHAGHGRPQQQGQRNGLQHLHQAHLAGQRRDDASWAPALDSSAWDEWGHGGPTAFVASPSLTERTPQEVRQALRRMGDTTIHGVGDGASFRRKDDDWSTNDIFNYLYADEIPIRLINPNDGDEPHDDNAKSEKKAVVQPPCWDAARCLDYLYGEDAYPLNGGIPAAKRNIFISTDRANEDGFEVCLHDTATTRSAGVASLMTWPVMVCEMLCAFVLWFVNLFARRNDENDENDDNDDNDDDDDDDENDENDDGHYNDGNDKNDENDENDENDDKNGEHDEHDEHDDGRCNDENDENDENDDGRHKHGKHEKHEKPENMRNTRKTIATRMTRTCKHFGKL